MVAKCAAVQRAPYPHATEHFDGWVWYELCTPYQHSTSSCHAGTYPRLGSKNRVRLPLLNQMIEIQWDTHARSFGVGSGSV